MIVKLFSLPIPLEVTRDTWLIGFTVVAYPVGYNIRAYEVRKTRDGFWLHERTVTARTERLIGRFDSLENAVLFLKREYASL